MKREADLVEVVVSTSRFDLRPLIREAMQKAPLRTAPDSDDSF